jgi:hypothetical protein
VLRASMPCARPLALFARSLLDDRLRLRNGRTVLIAEVTIFMNRSASWGRTVWWPVSHGERGERRLLDPNSIRCWTNEIVNERYRLP